MSNIQQTGQVTAGHLASWTTDGVLQDSGLTFTNTYGEFAYSKLGINFNSANTDYPLLINLPAGYTRYRISRILISGASATLTTATCGVFTSAGGLGSTIVASGTAVTVATNLDDTNNNMQSLTIVQQDTRSLIDTTLYFRVQTAEGSAVTANVTVLYAPLP